ncbi:hypothetical protein F4779DRAFT_436753 [Xylariaceae sp. FL0662B]|nr:hypothetical protein F4779DRAFT_436753 [Xylariaceae sp. FL0662B]
MSSASAAPKTDLSLTDYLGAGIAVILLCSLFVAARCAASISQRGKFLVDDYIIVLALVLIATIFAVNYEVTADMNLGMSKSTTTPLWTVQIVMAVNVVTALMLWASKVPILFMYIHLFGVKKWLRYSSYIGILTTALACLAGMIVALVGCKIENATPERLPICVDYSTIAGLIFGFISIFADVFIFCLPIPVILGLHLPLSKKIGVAVVFSTGIFAIVASIVGMYYKWQSWKGKSDFLPAIFCLVFEATTAVSIGCGPAINYFWSTYISNRWRFSKVAPPSAQESASKHPRIYTADFSGGSTECINSPGDAYGHYRLDEMR